jgi:hypothetical protein
MIESLQTFSKIIFDHFEDTQKSSKCPSLSKRKQSRRIIGVQQQTKEFHNVKMSMSIRENEYWLF